VRALGATEVSAGLGPCIHACCYRFKAPELDVLAQRYGEGVRAVTTLGEPALDLPHAVRCALAQGGAQLVVDLDRCTACGSDAFSYRARHDEARQALLVWREPASP
jgi:copper oxidase (laccase) domain-containing protein